MYSPCLTAFTTPLCYSVIASSRLSKQNHSILRCIPHPYLRILIRCTPVFINVSASKKSSLILLKNKHQTRQSNCTSLTKSIPQTPRMTLNPTYPLSCLTFFTTTMANLISNDALCVVRHHYPPQIIVDDLYTHLASHTTTTTIVTPVTIVLSITKQIFEIAQEM